MMQHRKLIILGTRGIPAQHGGFETHAQDMAIYLAQQGWCVIVYCQSNEKTRDIIITEFQNVTCIHISPYTKWFGKIISGALGTAFYDFRCILHALKEDRSAIWLTLGYNTGALSIIPKLWRRTHVMHMDGMEWKRGKWHWFYKLCFRFNYCIGGLLSDHLIADHPQMYRYMARCFFWKKRRIHTIAYGSRHVIHANDTVLNDLGLQKDAYALVVARPEPENNIDMIVKAWTLKSRPCKLVILGNYRDDVPYHADILRYKSDTILFPGPIHDPSAIDALRLNCRMYIHGHTVGGTNPSLVEALGAGSAVFAHDNVFNRFVAQDAAYYFNSVHGLSDLLDQLFCGSLDIETCKKQARIIHQTHYRYDIIMTEYEALLTSMMMD